MMINHNKYNIEASLDDDYETGSADNRCKYNLVYDFSEEFRANTKIGIRVLENSKIINSAILLTCAGATGIHKNMMVSVTDKLYIAVGDQIVSTQIPSLQKNWSIRADSATCFGVYYIHLHNCLIVHGELEISRISLDGKIQWQTGGKDIFTGDFHLTDNVITVVDFNNYKYKISIKDGGNC